LDIAQIFLGELLFVFLTFTGVDFGVEDVGRDIFGACGEKLGEELVTFGDDFFDVGELVSLDEGEASFKEIVVEFFERLLFRVE
jgi:hypothetical protein